MTTDKYPPLPTAAAKLHDDGYWTSVSGGPFRPKPVNFYAAEAYTADQIRAYADSATAMQSERHAQEIAAYELTVSNLMAQLAARGAPVVWRHDMGEENGGWEYFESASCSECQPLYAAPQPAEQPLLAEKERDAIAELNHAQWIALENVRLLAARHRKEDWAQHMLRFCDEAGVKSQAIHRAQTQPAPELTDDEIRPLIPQDMNWKYVVGEAGALEFARAIIAAHEAKKGGAA